LHHDGKNSIYKLHNCKTGTQLCRHPYNSLTNQLMASQFKDQSTHGLDNSWTGEFADWTIFQGYQIFKNHI